MHSCLRLTKLAIALAIGIQLLQPSAAARQEQPKSESDNLPQAIALSRGIDVDLEPTTERKNQNCENGICSDVGTPPGGGRRGAGSRCIAE